MHASTSGPNPADYQYTYDGAGNRKSQTVNGTTTNYTYNAANELTLAGSTSFTYDANGNETSNSAGLALTYNAKDQTTSVTANSGGLAGDQTVETNVDNDSPGQAEAFPFTASTSGAVNTLTLYVDSSTTANQVVVGLYTDTGGHPGTLLGQGTITSPTKGAWNSVTIPSVTLTASTTYWIAVLGPTGGGTPYFRDKASGGISQTSSQSTLSVLPATWSPGTTFATTSISAFASQPSVAMSYTGASHVARVAAGSSAFTSSALGLGIETVGSANTYYTRDNRGVLTEDRAPGGNYYYLFDGLGSVVALTDSSGNAVNTYSYDPYGKLLSSTGTVKNPWQFGGSYGAYTDSGTGLIKIGCRYYDPTVGHWTQQDPLGGGYSYAGNNPINLIDPTGKSSADCIAAALGALGIVLVALPFVAAALAPELFLAATLVATTGGFLVYAVAGGISASAQPQDQAGIFFGTAAVLLSLVPNEVGAVFSALLGWGGVADSLASCIAG